MAPKSSVSKKRPASDKRSTTSKRLRTKGTNIPEPDTVSVSQSANPASDEMSLDTPLVSDEESQMDDSDSADVSHNDPDIGSDDLPNVPHQDYYTQVTPSIQPFQSFPPGLAPTENFILGDGNCLFRSFAHRLYNDQNQRCGT
jgi:hypothetical protein